jgi:putative peptidoglycan lipid II flippase
MISILNILNIISILISLAFQVLLVKIFGAGLETDLYYLTIGIVQFVNVVFLGFLTDLYIPVYNDVKVKGEDRARKFAGAVLTLMLILSAFFSIFCLSLAPYLVKLFASGFNPEKITSAIKPLQILSLSIVFTSLSLVLNSTLQANLYMTVTYITALITPLFNLLSLLLFAKHFGINAIILSIVISSVTTFIILLIFQYKKLGVRFSNPFVHPDIGSLLKQNIPVRAGMLIYLFKGPITTNVLSFFPTGYITLVNYVTSILNTFIRVTNSPSNQVLYVKSSMLLSRNNIGELKDILFSTIKSNVVLFIGATMPAIILFKKVFGYLFSSKVTNEQLSIMFFLFLAFVPLYLIQSFEVPYTYVSMTMKEGKKIFKINAVYIVIYGILLLTGFYILDIYVIPFALFFAQLYNAISYSRLINRNLKIIDTSVLLTIGRLFLFVALLLGSNAILNNSPYYNLYVNLILISLWLFYLRKDLVTIFQFLTNRNFKK